MRHLKGDRVCRAMALTLLVACGGEEDRTGPAPGTPAAIRVRLSPDSLRSLGATSQASATLTDAEGRVVVTGSITWRSTDSTVATVSGSGLVTARQSGTAWIVGSAGALTDSARVIVDQQVAILRFTPVGIRFLRIGETVRVAVEALDAGQTPVSGVTFTWSSTEPDVATVSQAGEVTAVGNGAARILVTIPEDTVGLDATVAAPLALIHAAVVPLTQQIVLADRTLLIEEGRITAMGPSGTVQVPEGSFVVDATGLWVMPGLADMHTHFTCATRVECVNDLFLYVANGITTARTMFGNAFQLSVRNDVAAGRVVSPRLTVASPGMDGPGGAFGTAVTRTPAEALALVSAHAAAGFDYIKIYNNLPLDQFLAVRDEAARLGMPLIGHKPFSVPFDRVLEVPFATTEHTLGYEQGTTPTGSYFSSAPDLGEVRRFARAAVTMGTAETPTITVNGKIVGETAAYASAPEARFVSPGMVQFSTTTLPPWNASASARDQRIARIHDVVRTLRDEGVLLLLGSDAGVRWVLPGFSIHEELLEFVRAGLSPWEALKTGTVNAAIALGQTQEIGRVGVGFRADLLLLRANPLLDVAHVAQRAGVVLAGVYWDQPRIQRRLDAIAAGYGR